MNLRQTRRRLCSYNLAYKPAINAENMTSITYRFNFIYFSVALGMTFSMRISCHSTTVADPGIAGGGYDLCWGRRRRVTEWGGVYPPPTRGSGERRLSGVRVGHPSWPTIGGFSLLLLLATEYFCEYVCDICGSCVPRWSGFSWHRHSP